MKQEVDKLEFYLVDNVMEILGVSKSKAYQIMQDMNKELRDEGYFTIAGKVPKTYFEERFYFKGGDSRDSKKGVKNKKIS